MSFRLVNFNCGLSGFILALGFAAGGIVQASDVPPRAGRAIEFSDPKDVELVTNVNRLGEQLTVTRDLEQDFSGSPFSGQSESSLSGMMTLPRPSGGVIIQRRRARDSADERNDWTFMTPEDIMQDVALKGVLNHQDGGLGEGGLPPASVGRVYGRTGKANVLQRNDLFGLRRTSDARQDSSKSLDLNPFSDNSDRPGQSLRAMLGYDPDSRFSPSGAKPDRLLEVFGIRSDSGWGEPSSGDLQAKQAQEMQVKTYQNLLDGISDSQPSAARKSAAVANPWLSSTIITPPAENPLNPFAVMPAAVINPGLLAPSAPAAPVPLSLAPAPYLPQNPQANSMLMRKPDFSPVRRTF